MRDPAIRAALDAAGEAVRQTGSLPVLCSGFCELPPCHCSRVAAAAAVAAFLRDFYEAPGDHRVWTLREIAAAVEAEAGDE